MSASVRNKDDYVNAGVGGMLAGSVFGVKCEYSCVCIFITYNQYDACNYPLCVCGVCGCGIKFLESLAFGLLTVGRNGGSVSVWAIIVHIHL